MCFSDCSGGYSTYFGCVDGTTENTKLLAPRYDAEIE